MNLHGDRISDGIFATQLKEGAHPTIWNRNEKPAEHRNIIHDPEGKSSKSSSAPMSAAVGGIGS